MMSNMGGTPGALRLGPGVQLISSVTALSASVVRQGLDPPVQMVPGLLGSIAKGVMKSPVSRPRSRSLMNRGPSPNPGEFCTR